MTIYPYHRSKPRQHITISLCDKALLSQCETFETGLFHFVTIYLCFVATYLCFVTTYLCFFDNISLSCDNISISCNNMSIYCNNRPMYHSSAGLRNLWKAGKKLLVRTKRIYEDHEVSQGVLNRCETVISPAGAYMQNGRRGRKILANSAKEFVVNAQMVVLTKNAIG